MFPSNLRLPDFTSQTPAQMADRVLESLARQRQVVTDCLAQNHPSFNSFVRPQEHAEHASAFEWAPLAQLVYTCDSPEARSAYDRVMPAITEFNTWLMDQDAIHGALCTIRDTDTLDTWQEAVVRNGIRAFERRGVGLPKATKDRLAQVDQDLSLAGTRFGRNIQDTTDSWHMPLSEDQVHDMPASALALLRQAGKENGSPTGLGATLQMPVVSAILAHCPDREVRRVLHDAHNTRCTTEGVGGAERCNVPTILSILALRHEKALLTGKKDYSHMALEDNMSKAPTAAVDLLHRVRARARQAAQVEWDTLTQYASEECGIADMKAYDFAFVAEKQRQALFGLSDETVKQYFPYEAALGGVLDVASKLFGVSFQRQPSVDTWHPSVEFYAVHEGDKIIAGVYIDPFARTGKKNGAWASAMVRKLENEALPVSSLNCNSAAPAEGKHALLTHTEVVTLFHEFGHGLHLMLGQSPYPSVDMSGVERDAIEGPSQLMENFAWDKATLRSFAKHASTGEVIPEAIVDQLQAARRHNGALAIVRQLVFGLTDLELHQGAPVASETELWAVQDTIRNDTAIAGLTPVGGDKTLTSFAHIFQGGYASAYYSYLWAEVLSADAFDAFAGESSPLNAEVGRRYREEVLATGSVRPSLDSFVAFRARDPDPSALMAAKGMSTPKRASPTP